MSSHHIVRDEQEPALILHRLVTYSEQILHSLLEWSPTVISCEPAIEKFTSLGHKLDVALISLNNYDWFRTLLEPQTPIKLVAVHGEDYLKTALTLLKKDNHRAVNVVTNEESVFEVIQLLENWIQYLDLVIYTEQQRIIFVKSKTFRKWFPKGSKVTIQSISGVCQWSAEGLDKDLKGLISDHYEGEKTKEGEVTISCSQSPFLVIEEL